MTFALTYRSYLISHHYGRIGPTAPQTIALYTGRRYSNPVDYPHGSTEALADDVLERDTQEGDSEGRGIDHGSWLPSRTVCCHLAAVCPVADTANYNHRKGVVEMGGLGDARRLHPHQAAMAHPGRTPRDCPPSGWKREQLARVKSIRSLAPGALRIADGSRMSAVTIAVPPCLASSARKPPQQKRYAHGTSRARLTEREPCRPIGAVRQILFIGSAQSSGII